MVQSKTTAAAFNKAWEKRYRDLPDVDATVCDFYGLMYVRAREGETFFSSLRFLRRIRWRKSHPKVMQKVYRSFACLHR